MSDTNRRPVSREDALEMILAETAKNPYTPKKPVRPTTPPRQSQTTNDVQRGNTSYSNTGVYERVRSKPEPVSPDEMMRPITEAQKTEEAKARAAKKIEEIKRARQQREQREQLYTMYPPSPEDKKVRTRVIPAIKEDEPEQEMSYQPYDEDEYMDEYDENDYFENSTSYTKWSNEYSTASSGILNDILEIVESAFAVIFIIIMIFTYIIGVVVVDGISMSPTLEGNDKLIVRSIGYSPKSGDVVVIDCDNAHLISESGKVVETEGLDKMIVKRVIATGGQTVDIDFESGTVSVDGNVLEENYISEPTTRDEYAFEYPLTIPEGYVFALGDNRNLSKDSRHPEIGLVPEGDITGKVMMRIYPFGKFGAID